MSANAYTNIALATGARAAGIYLLSFAPREWLAADVVTDFATGKVITAVTLLSGKEWLYINFVPETVDFTETPKSTESGDYFELSFTGTITAYGDAAQLALETYRYHEWVAIFTDQGKKQRIAGNAVTGLRFAANFKLLGKNGGNASYSFTLAMESPQRAPFYTP